MKYLVKRMPSDEILHYGISGQRWGHRRYQREDGQWTPEGQDRYSTDTDGKYGESGNRSEVQKTSKEKRHTDKKNTNKKNADKKEIIDQTLENEMDENMGSKRASKLISAGMSCLNTYLTYKSFKEEWW